MKKNYYRKKTKLIRTGIINSFQREKLTNKKEKVGTPWEIVENLSKQINLDFKILLNKGLLTRYNNQEEVYFFNLKKELSHEKMFNGVIFNSKKGPIILGNNVKIKPFSYLEGPLFIGDNSELINVRISNSSIGNTCKISGEISNSIMGNFSNKSHESALLFSYIGDWCNIAGYTNTTNLNINYSPIKIQFRNQIVETGMIKFVSVICDFVRLGSGITINPGTFIDYASTILTLPNISGYFPPFTKFKKGKFYSYFEFKNEMELIMKRRGQKPNNYLLEKWRKLIDKNYE